MGMSLDQIMASKGLGESNRQPRRGGGGAGGGGRGDRNSNSNPRSLKSTSNSRGQRQQAPSSSSLRSETTRRTSSKLAELNKELTIVQHPYAIKFLVSHALAGVIIGTGGNVINELKEITQAWINVSGLVNAALPRTVYVKGTEAQVTLASSMLWELIGHQQNAANNGNELAGWKPSYARKNPGNFDEVEVNGCLAIPADCAGIVLGPGGKSLNYIRGANTVKVELSKFEDVDDELQERIVSLVGGTGGCMAATVMIIKRMVEQNQEFGYAVDRA